MLDKTVLLVEDEKRLLHSTSKLLRRHFNVIGVLNAELALKSLETEAIDFIVLDIVLPDMSGVDLLKQIRVHDKNLPVIIVTGKSCLQYAEACANLGVVGYMNKPYDISELTEKIKSTLRPLEMEETKNQGKLNNKSAIHPKLLQALEQIHLNYAADLRLRAIAGEIGISYGYLANLFKKYEGASFTECLHRFRIERAKELMERNNLSISVIMLKTGFKSEQYFYRQFKKYAGSTPASFRKNLS